MNYQFFGTAGIISGLLFIAFGVLMIVSAIGDCDNWYYKVPELLYKIAWICFLTVLAFWLVVGIICGLDALWGWGLVR